VTSRGDSLDDEFLAERIPEPELMDEPEQAEAYAAADFADVNQGFVDAFRRSFPELVEGRLIDLGCGPADIPLRIAGAISRVDIVAVDGARAMLTLARRAVASSRFASRIRLVTARVQDLPIRGRWFDACVSNSLLHHLPEPALFWPSVRGACRPRAPIFVMDLFRPPTRRGAAEIVEEAAGEESPILRRDFYNSLLAAFTVEEVRAQLADAGLAHCSCEIVSERHWRVAGRNP
jgi:SAM-dependent methyltransferase